VEGMNAEFVIAEVEQGYTIDVSTMASKSKNTPFNGVAVFGKVLETVISAQFYTPPANLNA